MTFLKGNMFVHFDLTAFGKNFKESSDDRIDLWVDADWSTPRSTSGWVMIWNGTVMQATLRTQATPALSSAEAEIMSANEAAREAVWLSHVLGEVEENRLESDYTGTHLQQ